MGTGWSQEDEGWSQEDEGSSQQAQHQAIIAPKPGKTSTNLHNNHNTKNEALLHGRKDLVNKLPHNCETIIKDSDSPIDKSSLHKLYEQLHAGVYLNDRRMKYWVERRGKINCFMVLARGLSIAWAEDERQWYFHDIHTSEGQITVAQLRSICWLEVHGKLRTEYLTPGVTYEVAYLIMFEFSSYGWKVPVNFRLTLPNGSKQEHKEILMGQPQDKWIRIPVGHFKASPEMMGELEFSLYEHSGNWKKGMTIKGVVIEPKFT